MFRILQIIDLDLDLSNGIIIIDQINDYLFQFFLLLNEFVVMFEVSMVVQDMIVVVINGLGLKDVLSLFEYFYEILLLLCWQIDEIIILNLMNISWIGMVWLLVCL